MNNYHIDNFYHINKNFLRKNGLNIKEDLIINNIISFRQYFLEKYGEEICEAFKTQNDKCFDVKNLENFSKIYNLKPLTKTSIQRIIREILDFNGKISTKEIPIDIKEKSKKYENFFLSLRIIISIEAIYYFAKLK